MPTERETREALGLSVEEEAPLGDQSFWGLTIQAYADAPVLGEMLDRGQTANED